MDAFEHDPTYPALYQKPGLYQKLDASPHLGKDTYLASEPPPQAEALLHPVQHYRSIFVSDTHFGSDISLPKRFSRFLTHVTADSFFVVGDGVDAWKMALNVLFGRPLLRPTEVDAGKTLLGRQETKKTILGGNHDELLRLIAGASYENTSILLNAVHETVTGAKMLVLHGDEFDKSSRLLSVFATCLFGFMSDLSRLSDHLRANNFFDRFLASIGLPSDWSFAHSVKCASDRLAVRSTSDDAMCKHLFKLNAEIFARNRKHRPEHQEPYYSGIIHGHRHAAGIRYFSSPIDKTTMLPMGPINLVLVDLGHWTGPPRKERKEMTEKWRDKLKYPTCTGLLEQIDGRFELIEWRNKINVIATFTIDAKGEPRPEAPSQRQRSFVVASHEASPS